MSGRWSAAERYLTIASASLIGVVSFIALSYRCPLGAWHAPANPDELRELLRGVLRLGDTPDDAPRREQLDRFVADASRLPHLAGSSEPLRSPALTPYTREELLAFLGDVALFHNDEWHKPAETYYYYLFWLRRDLSSPDWSVSLQARTNPTLAKFLMGGALHLQVPGPYPIRDLTMQEMYDRWWRVRPFLLAAMDRRTLVAARRTSALFGAGSVVLLFLLGCRSGGVRGFATGGLGAALLFASPLFRYYASRATVDVMLVFFMIGGGLVASYFVPIALARAKADRPARRRLAGTTLMMGGWAGLTCAIKLNGALVGIGAALGCAAGWCACALRPRLRRGTSDPIGLAGPTQPAAMLTAAGVIAFAFFWALNPYYYHHPIGRLQQTLREMRQELGANQRTVGPAITTRSEALNAVFYYCAMLSGPNGAEMLVRSDQMPFEPMDRRAVIAPGLFWLRSLLVLGGLTLAVLFVVTRPVTNPVERDTAAVWFALLGWALALILGSIAWLPLRWARYFLVPLAPGAVLVSSGWCHGLGWILGRLRKSLDQWRQRGALGGAVQR